MRSWGFTYKSDRIIWEKTTAAGSREILLVAAQDELVKPSRIFEVEVLGDQHA